MKQKLKVQKRKNTPKKQKTTSNRLIIGIIILFVSLFIIVIFSGQQQNFQGNAAQNAITPTFGTLGDCQTTGGCPTGTTNVPNNSTLTSAPGKNTKPTQATLQPCASAQDTNIAIMAKHEKHTEKIESNNNFFQSIVQLLLQLIQLLLQLLGGGTTSPTPVTIPTVAPQPTGQQPSGTQPSTVPNPTQIPCSPSSAPQPTSSPSIPVPTGSGSTTECVTSADMGRCPTNGYYTDPQIVGGTNPWVNQNVWGKGSTNYQQTLHATGASSWYITASVSNNSSGAVLTFPNTGWSMPAKTIDSYSTITSSWNVTIPTDNKTSAGWAAYDLWFNNWADEVMIQTDIVANSNYNCSSAASTTINGQAWHLCDFGSERVVKPGTDDNNIRNEPSGSVDVLGILKWLEQTGHLPASSAWTAGSFGFEVTNTSGTTQTFKVNGFTWTSQ